MLLLAERQSTCVSGWRVLFSVCLPEHLYRSQITKDKVCVSRGTKIRFLNSPLISFRIVLTKFAQPETAGRGCRGMPVNLPPQRWILQEGQYFRRRYFYFVLEDVGRQQFQ